ncbi:MAG: hypothetical protein ACRENP_08000 [Longimicrobiales bacterium]
MPAPKLRTCLPLAIVLASCSGGTTSPDPIPGGGAILLVVAPSTLDLIAGQSGQVAVTSSGLNGYNGPINLSVPGAPAGLSAVFSPASVASGTLSSLATIGTATSTTPGTYNVRIRADGQGGVTASFTLSITVRAAAAGAYTVTAQPAALTVARNTTDTAVVRLTRTSFNGAVSLSVSGAPAGVTAILSPSTITADSSFLIITVGTTATPATYTLLITGQTQGLANRTATFQLTVAAAASTQWSRIAAGVDISCGLNRAGAAFCWGYLQRPIAVPGGIVFSDVQAGRRHACGIATSGDAYCWGSGGSGELGNGSNGPSSTPVLVSGGHKWIAVKPGWHTTCGVTTTNNIYCWGDVLGTNAPNQGNTSVPVLLAGGLNWAGVGAAFLGHCAFTTGGDAYCWQLIGGLAGLELISGGHRWRSVVAGDRYQCGIRNDNVAFCMGSGGAGNLGHGIAADSPTWATVAGARVWASLSTSRFFSGVAIHTCGVTTTGEGLCWGGNQIGQLGTGSSTMSEVVPTRIAGGHTWIQLTVGHAFTCGVTTTFEAYCWGNGGNLGNGGPLPSPTPTRVLDP